MSGHDGQAGGALCRRTRMRMRVRGLGAKHDAQELGGRAVWAKHTTAHRATLAQGRRWRRDVRAGQVEAGLDGRSTTVGEIERKGKWTSGCRWMKQDEQVELLQCWVEEATGKRK